MKQKRKKLNKIINKFEMNEFAEDEQTADSTHTTKNNLYWILTQQTRYVNQLNPMVIFYFGNLRKLLSANVEVT